VLDLQGRLKRWRTVSVVRIIFVMLSVMIFSNSVFAQAAGAGAAGEGGDVEAFVQDTKSDLLVVVAGGLAGAVLGLSTLSFVDEPKKHTRNILVGASIGIIIGVGYVAFSQANRSRQMFYGPGEEEGAMEEQAYKAPRTFDTLARNLWHDEEISQRYPLNNSINQIGYSFSY